MANDKIYQMVTERIVAEIRKAIEAIESGKGGIAPWRKPWFSTGMPCNLVSKREYRGINAFLLTCFGFSSPYFLTYNQAAQMGGKVKRGEHGIPVVFWKVTKYDTDKDGKPYGCDGQGRKIEKKVFLLRYYTVFNISQCEGIPESKIPAVKIRQFNPIAEGDAIIANMPHAPKMEHGCGRAFYRPTTDTIGMPSKTEFTSDGEYYSTAFHEMVHATGHASRLNRAEVMDGNIFGNHAYSAEELVAEMGSVFLCNEIGLEATFNNSLAYLKSWLEKFKDDTHMLIVASGRAQKAADYILNRKADADKDDDKDKDKSENK